MKMYNSNNLKAFVVVMALATAGAEWKPAVTTRYYDCCKPSCSWPGKAAVTRPVASCSADNRVISSNSVSGCEPGGVAFNCDRQTSFAINSSLSYGFVAAKVSQLTERELCCSCWELLFTSGPVKGKRMIVHVTNTGYDLGGDHFDIAMPGGGQGIFLGCDKQFNGITFGARYGGVAKREECNQLPPRLRKGCFWRFDWFKNADNPNVMARKTKCPKQLVDVTMCRRIDG